MRLFATALLAGIAVAATGCQLVYRLPTRQGNVLEQKDLGQLKLGMSSEQVRFLLGTPIASSPLREDRWEYVAYYKSPRGEEINRHVTLYFADDKLSRIVGAEPMAGRDALTSPDVDSLLRQDRKDRSDRERAKDSAETGVVIKPNR